MHAQLFTTLAGTSVHVNRKKNVQEQKDTIEHYALELSVPEAIKELRRRLGRTQQQFANDLGLAIRTIAHYESDRIPKPGQMTVFAKLAAEKNHMDLAAYFNDKIIQSLGVSAKISLRAATLIRAVLTEHIPKLKWSTTEEQQAIQLAALKLGAALQILEEANPFRADSKERLEDEVESE